MNILGAHKFSKVTKCFSKFVTRCHLNKMDKGSINHAFFRWFYCCKLCFHPMCIAKATDLKRDKLATLKKPFTMVNCCLLWYKKLKCDLNQCVDPENIHTPFLPPQECFCPLQGTVVDSAVFFFHPFFLASVVLIYTNYMHKPLYDKWTLQKFSS